MGNNFSKAKAKNDASTSRSNSGNRRRTQIRRVSLGHTSIIAIHIGNKIVVCAEGRTTVTISHRGRVNSNFVQRENTRKLKVFGRYIVAKSGNQEISQKLLEFVETELKKKEISLSTIMDSIKNMDPERRGNIGIFGFDNDGEAQMLTAFESRLLSYFTSEGDKVEMVTMGLGANYLSEVFSNMTKETPENQSRRDNPEIDKIALLSVIEACLRDPGSGGELTLAEVNKGFPPKVTLREPFLSCIIQNFAAFEEYFKRCFIILSEKGNPGDFNESNIRLTMKACYEEIADFKVFVQKSNKVYRLVSCRTEAEKNRMKDEHRNISSSILQTYTGNGKVEIRFVMTVDKKYLISLA